MSSSQPALAALCGSMRTESYNRKLLRLAAAEAEKRGARVDVIDLRALNLPLYDGDLEAEQGLPPGAQELKDRIAPVQGVLIASPEYNHSIPGTFKNALDWASRGGSPFRDKTGLLMGTATGPFGGLRSLQHLRQVMLTLGLWLVPALVTVARAAETFDGQGALTDPALQKNLEDQVGVLLNRL